MRKPARIAAALLIAGVIAGSACSDSNPTSPSQSMRVTDAEHGKLLGGLLGGVTDVIGTLVDALIPPVTRNTPLASDVSWAFWAGPAGAVSSNSSVGLTIVIPRGALASTKRITVTALEGAPIAYKFEPHGLIFLRPVVLTQNLHGTSAGGLLSLPLLSGAYFATDRLELTDDGLAAVTEIIPALTGLLTKTASFPIGHFSGYILASGRSGDGGEQEDGR